MVLSLATQEVILLAIPDAGIFLKWPRVLESALSISCGLYTSNTLAHRFERCGMRVTHIYVEPFITGDEALYKLIHTPKHITQDYASKVILMDALYEGWLIDSLVC